MSKGFMRAKRCVLAACVGLTAAGCDLVAETGQTLVLANRGAVFGSGGNARSAPLPALRVRAGGSGVVQDADLVGGGIVVEQVGQARYARAGAGILADSGGAIRVQQGFVAGGSVLVQVPESFPDRPAPAILATGASIDIAAGMLRGGAAVSLAGPMRQLLLAPALEINGGTLRVTGGTFTTGDSDPVDVAAARFSVLATNAEVEIRGGIFGDALATTDGRTRILGGTFESLVFLSSTASGCSELRGGLVSGIAVSRGRLRVAGSDLALQPGDAGASLLTGTLENGQAVSARVVQQNGGVVELVAAGAPGCP